MLKVVGASWLQTKISSYILGLMGVLAIMALFVGQIERIQDDGNYAATVFYSEKTGYRIEYWGQSNQLADIPKGVARAYFRMDLDSTGWSLLEVETNASYPDKVQAYAAGIVEGALTWYPIHAHLENTVRARCTGHEKRCERIRDALERSFDVWKTRASQLAATDPFWHHVSLYYTQISGIYRGWNHGVERSLNEYDRDIADLYWLNAFADVKEIKHKLNISLDDIPLEQMPGLSTAFLRIVNDTTKDGKAKNKLYVAHNAAGSYASMTRILKRYKLNYRLSEAEDSPSSGGTIVEFSGYPGSITSQDELYVLRGKKHQLAVTGTPLNNYNQRLWKDVNITEQLPVGPRVTAANRLATNVSEWGHILARSNSGTACKQWLVVDFTRLHQLAPRRNGKLASKTDAATEIICSTNNDIKHTVVHRTSSNGRKGLAWIIEQVPGLTHSADISDALLEKSYWVTYGLPFFQDIANATHVTRMEEFYGKIFSVSESFQAEKFNLQHKNAMTFESVAKLMRQYNRSLLKDEDEAQNCLHNGTEEAKLACVINKSIQWPMFGARGDIVSKNKEAFGIIDTKIVSESENSTDLSIFAISGPPYSQEISNSHSKLNKGNIATSNLNNDKQKQSIKGFEISDLVKQNEESVPPFQWSTSEFRDKSHDGLPDRWAFHPFVPVWSW